MHLLKCFGVALCVALLPSSLSLRSASSSLTPYRDGVVLEYGPMKWILKGGWRGAFETCERWVLVEAAAEGVFQLWRVLRQSKLAACLCSFPGGESARARRASARAVAKLYAMMVLVPGSAAPLLYAAAEHLAGGARPHWLVAVVAYPVLGAWAAFTAFVKFAFVVFALNTLAGFEDFDSPGWLLG